MGRIDLKIDKILEYQIDNELSNIDLAKKIGISTQVLSRVMETGRGSAPTMLRIIDFNKKNNI